MSESAKEPPDEAMTQIPDEADLEEFYTLMAQEVPAMDDLTLAALGDPLDLARRYYREDNRPVLYDAERARR